MNNTSGSFLKKILPLTVLTALCLIIAGLPQLSSAQSFDKGLKNYKKGDYAKSASIFSDINTPKGLLFSGKAYFGMGKYLTAKTYLNQITKQEKPTIYLESQYQTALANFQLGNYATALEDLYPFKAQQRKTEIVTKALRFYKQLLSYLTINQRKKAFQQVNSAQIKLDLVKEAFGKVDYSTAKMLYRQLQNIKTDTAGTQMSNLKDIVADSTSYAVQQSYGQHASAPDGITYNIGAALPSFQEGGRRKKISQGLYYGYVFAAEEFNRNHPNKKAFIRYRNTAANKDTAAYNMSTFAWTYNADAVLGPLFSAPAESMAKLAEQYQIPMLAPLANSDTLNTDNPYVFQANPTATAHGKRMAKYAVEKLKMDTLAVLAEKNTTGASSAYAFRKEAEKRGAKVEYFFVKDLASQGLEIKDYTKYFSTNRVKIDSTSLHHLDGVYAPFTSQAASSLGELLLADLKTMNSSLTILGSQEWGKMNIPADLLANRTIYFSESYYTSENNPQFKKFRKDFKKRFKTKPNRFAVVGYDAASFMLKTLDKVENPARLKNALTSQPLYQGLANDISFGGSHINQEVRVFTITEDGTKPITE